jgi:hypothetical protein
MRRRLRKRFLVGDLALVTVIAAVTVALASMSSGSVDGPRGSGDRQTDAGVPAGATMLAVKPVPFGRPLPAGFLGLSLEYSSLEDYAGQDPGAIDPVLERLIANINPGQAPVLRIGGDTTDWTWWPIRGLSKPPGVSYTLTRRWLQVTRALVHGLGARLILGINLEADNVQLAGTEARMLVAGLGHDSVRALEIGNEPALYASFPWYRTATGAKIPGRPRDYDAAAYTRDFARFARALPPLPLAGPALGASRWMQNLAPFLAAQPRLGLVTLHRYPLQLCYTPTRSLEHPTLDHLMATAATTGLADSFTRDVATAHARHLPLRIDEINSVSCGADRAVSDTFASSLWALDAMFELDRVGIDGVNLHTFPGAGYELFKITRTDGRWRAAVAPEYYGLLMFAQAAAPGSRLLSIAGAAGGQVKAWATGSRDGTVRVVLINKSVRARVLAITLPHVSGTATVERLRAPSLTASSGVTLGGQSLGSQTYTGQLAGQPQRDSVAPVGSRYVVSLPAGSAAMLVAR